MGVRTAGVDLVPLRDADRIVLAADDGSFSRHGPRDGQRTGLGDRLPSHALLPAADNVLMMPMLKVSIVVTKPVLWLHRTLHEEGTNLPPACHRDREP